MDRDNSIGKRKEIVRRGGPPVNSVIMDDSQAILLTRETMIYIANIISNKHIHRKMTSQELTSLQEFIRNMSFRDFHGKKYAEATKEIAERFTKRRLIDVGLSAYNNTSIKDWQNNEIKTLTADENPYSYNNFADKVGETAHIEVQRRRIGTSGYRDKNKDRDLICCMDDLTDLVRAHLSADHLSRAIKQAWGMRITYNDIAVKNSVIAFDSLYRNNLYNIPPPHNSPRPLYPAKLQFTINRSTNGSDGIRIGQDTKKYVEMSVGEIILPLGREIDLSYSRITLLIEELKEQSILEGGGGDRRYHFEFYATKRDHPTVPGRSNIVLHTRDNQSVFRFYYPVAQLSTATLIFRNPIDFVRLPSDKIVFNVAAGSPAIFTTASGLAHDIPVGTYIYITDYVAGSAGENAETNRPEGHIITVPSSTTFTITALGGNDIDLNLSSPQLNLEIWPGVDRIRIPINFKSLE